MSLKTQDLMNGKSVVIKNVFHPKSFGITNAFWPSITSLDREYSMIEVYAPYLTIAHTEIIAYKCACQAVVHDNIVVIWTKPLWITRPLSVVTNAAIFHCWHVSRTSLPPCLLSTLALDWWFRDFVILHLPLICCFSFPLSLCWLAVTLL